MKIVFVFAFAASLWGADLTVRISSDSEDAAEAVWRSLNQQAQGRNLRFVRATPATTPDYTLIVTWMRGGPGRIPMAQIHVYGKDHAPLYVVWKRGVWTRGRAVIRCVAVLVRDFARHAP